MSNQALTVAGKTLRPHGALITPDFKKSRVLCADPWDFVSLWLKRKHQDDALFYWEQARHFYEASILLPSLSSPLTSYYCFLNATKALLTAKKVTFSENHGLSGKSIGKKTSLENEIVNFKGAGILPALCNLLGEVLSNKEYNLKDILWRMPFIHRSFCLTYTSATELFIPILKPCFIKKEGATESWFFANIDKRYINAHIEDAVAPGFEIYNNPETKMYELRKEKRFIWSSRKLEESICNLTKYHTTLRKRVVPIFASENRWYFIKNVSGYNDIQHSQLVLIFAAMHRLSELSRYDPIVFSNHFNVNHNWLLSEFITNAPNQFVYGIASEITGLEFIKPDAF